MPKRKTVLIVGATAIVLVIIVFALFSSSMSPISSFISPVSAKGNVIVTLKDEETGKPIGKVSGGYVRVVLGGVDRGYLTDYGELKIEGVDPGSHELMLIVPSYGEVRRFVDVGSGQTVPVDIKVNMPNPVFSVGVDVKLTGTAFWENLFGDSETGHIKVSLTNVGDADSVSTSVLVIVYKKDDLSMPIATEMLNFQSLVPRSRGGGSETEEWACEAFLWGPGEVVATVVFDGWPYTPQNRQVVSQVSVPASMMDELTNSILNYLNQNPDLVINTVAKIVIGALA